MWNVALLHIVDSRQPRSAPQSSLELCQRLRVPLGQDLHRTVAQVPYDSSQSQPLRFLQDEPPEPYPLHPPPHQVARPRPRSAPPRPPPPPPPPPPPTLP